MPGKISVISFSEHGFRFQESLRPDIEQWAALQDMQTEWYCKDSSGFGVEGYTPVTVPTKEWSANRFEDSDIIVYLCTVAKAVRNFAPSIKGQAEDPAVIAIDQQGKYSVPVLSGKKGEAYEMSLWLEQKSGITAVNSGGIIMEAGFNVEEYAAGNNMVISNSNYAKEITAALDSGEKIGFYTSFPVKGDLPEGMYWAETGPLGIYLSPSYKNCYFGHTLWLIPRCMELGISIENDLTPKDIEIFMNDTLKTMNLYPESISRVNAVDGVYTPVIEAICAANDYPVTVVSQEALARYRDAFPGKNDAEYAALVSGDARIVSVMSSVSGITIAVALKKTYVTFNKD